MRWRAIERLVLLVFALVALVSSVWVGGCGSSDPGIAEPVTNARDASSFDAAPPDAGLVAPPADAAVPSGSPFNVTGAVSTRATGISVTFDGAPNVAQATNVANYAVPGLTLSAVTLAGNVATITTTVQSGLQPYTIRVSGVTRANDAALLTTSTADFMGRDPFNVVSADSTSAVNITVTFDAPPDAVQAKTRANYTVPGLVLSGTPTLSGNTVTLTTSGQLAQMYTVTVANVTRAAGAEPLLERTGTFIGTAVQPPTVTNVVVTSTLPNNGTTAYNTGTTTVVVTGTHLGTVACPAGVALDDLDGVDAPSQTKPTACTVDSNTQITATFPAGIRTNGAIGWNVQVTNMVATNGMSAVRFVPVAGLVISEIYTGTSLATDHEFIEIYNPTATVINTTAAGIGLKVHVRSSAGGDTNKTLTAVTGGIVPSHGFLLVVSSASAAGDAWFASRDYTYSASLVANGGVYLSLSATDNAKVLDKVGWGTQPAGGFEGTALANILSNFSAERKPAGGAGNATDTDSNVADFNAPSLVVTPLGSADAPQP